RLRLGIIRQRNSVGDHDFSNLRFGNVLHGRRRKYRVRSAGIDAGRATLDEGIGRLHQRARSIDEVVNYQTSSPVHVTNNVHDFGHIHFHSPLIEMASAASIFLAKNRARSTPPASGETTVRLGKFIFLKWSTSTGEAKRWSTGILKNPCNCGACKSTISARCAPAVVNRSATSFDEM